MYQSHTIRAPVFPFQSTMRMTPFYPAPSSQTSLPPPATAEVLRPAIQIQLSPPVATRTEMRRFNSPPAASREVLAPYSPNMFRVVDNPEPQQLAPKPCQSNSKTMTPRKRKGKNLLPRLSPKVLRLSPKTSRTKHKNWSHDETTMFLDVVAVWTKKLRVAGKKQRTWLAVSRQYHLVCEQNG